MNTRDTESVDRLLSSIKSGIGYCYQTLSDSTEVLEGKFNENYAFILNKLTEIENKIENQRHQIITLESQNKPTRDMESLDRLLSSIYVLLKDNTEKVTTMSANMENLKSMLGWDSRIEKANAIVSKYEERK